MQSTPLIETVPPWTLCRYDSVTSTNDLARSLRRDNDGWLAVSAAFQAAGRGQHGRVWHAPRGANLLVTFVPPPTAIACGDAIVAAAAVAVCATLDACGLAARAKWPNDVRVRDAKIAGVLIERDGPDVYIGVGLNVDWPPERHAAAPGETWTSIRAECARSPGPQAMLRLLADALVVQLRDAPANVVARYRALLPRADAPVSAYVDGRWQPAHIVGVTSDCGLEIRLRDGSPAIVRSSAHMRTM